MSSPLDVVDQGVAFSLKTSIATYHQGKMLHVSHGAC